MQADQLISQLFDEWAAAYARGERPDPRDYLRRSGRHREQLSVLMERYLQAAPRPAPTDEDIDLVEAWMRGHSPLAELRSQRGISRDQIVAAIVERFALRDEQRAAVKAHYHRLEAGLTDPGHLSKRLRAFLAEALDVAPGAISGSKPRQIRASTAFRDESRLMPREARLARGQPAEDDEEVRSLFLSEG